jgi:hypothetical protein
VVDGEEKVGVRRTFGAEVQNVDRGDKALDRERIGVAVGIVLAGDPVMRRVEMGAGVFAKLQPVPGPEGAVLVVFADPVDLDRRGVLGEVRRQFQKRGLGPSTPEQSTTSIAPEAIIAPTCASRFAVILVPPSLRERLDSIRCKCKYSGRVVWPLLLTEWSAADRRRRRLALRLRAGCSKVGDEWRHENAHDRSGRRNLPMRPRLRQGPRAPLRFLAGGTDVLVQMRAGMVQPDDLIDLKAIPGTDADRARTDGGWRIGIAVPGIVLGAHAGLRATGPAWSRG